MGSTTQDSNNNGTGTGGGHGPGEALVLPYPRLQVGPDLVAQLFQLQPVGSAISSKSPQIVTRNCHPHKEVFCEIPFEWLDNELLKVCSLSPHQTVNVIPWDPGNEAITGEVHSFGYSGLFETVGGKTLATCSQHRPIYFASES